MILAPQDRSRTLAEQLSRAFTLLGWLVAAGLIVTTLAYAVGRAWLTPEFDRSRAAIKAADAAYTAMLDEETGLRGYLLTHDARDLEPYTRGEVSLAEANLALAESAGSVPELAVTMLGTRLAEERWREQWAAAAADTRPDAVAPSFLAGRALFDTYRGEQAAFASALVLHREALSRREQGLIQARLALDLTVFIAVLLLALRQHRALHDVIVLPIAALLRHIRRVRDGSLETTDDHPGARELAELADGLNEMVLALAAARESSASRDETLRNHSVQLHQILDASREFSESLNLDYVVGAVRESTAAVGGYERVIVWLMDDQQKRLVDSAESAAAPSRDTPVGMGQGLAGRAAKSGRITFEGPAGHVRFGDGELGPARAIAIPLIVGARVVGVLEARHGEAKVATREVIEVLEMLATHAATAIESARLHEVIEERSQVDALTRLFNRRRLETDLDVECKRCVRYGRPLTFVMLDVDHFKLFNVAHGHPQGDTALQEVAEIITGCVRTTDTAYRYGGEEFCILLRETAASEGMHFAERVRLRIEQRFASGASAGITASFGVADFSLDTPSPRALVEEADAAMYESKHAGRNRVALRTRPPSVVPPGIG